MTISVKLTSYSDYMEMSMDGFILFLGCFDKYMLKIWKFAINCLIFASIITNAKNI